MKHQLFPSSPPLGPAALQCYCDRCSPNSSCTTDGVCFVNIRKIAGRLTPDQRQCVAEEELIPRDRPFVCAKAKPDSGIYPICCTVDFCNKEPDLTGFDGEEKKCLFFFF